MRLHQDLNWHSIYKTELNASESGESLLDKGPSARNGTPLQFLANNVAHTSRGINGNDGNLR